MIEERKLNGKFKNIIDFMNRVKSDVINKRQLEKLIQAGAFDSIEKNRSKLFTNVSKFIELYGGEKIVDQTLLFEEREISFEDKNLFFQKFNMWNNFEILANELEVIGFYFSDHPLNYFPKLFFEEQKINTFNNLLLNKDMNTSKVCGAVLDIKERSNKDGKKYAFVTVSETENQFELTIFSENLYKYRPLLKEGNLLIFYIDIIKNKSDTRFIIKKILSLDSVFKASNFKFSIYSSVENIIKFKDDIFEKNPHNNSSLDLFINIDNKLINFDFKKYSIKSYKILDELKKSKILDYSLEMS